MVTYVMFAITCYDYVMLILKKPALLKKLLSYKREPSKVLLLFPFLLTAIISQPATAFDNDAEFDVNPNSPIIKDAFEWQIILDLSLAYQPVLLKSVEQSEFSHFLQPALYVDLSYKGFFLQTNQRRSSAVLDSSEFGYQLIVKEDWQLDIIVKAYLDGFDPDGLIDYANANPSLFEGLKERQATGGIALRYSHFFENSIFYIDFASADTGLNLYKDDVNGLIVDSFYSYLLPYRNWDIYLGAGLTYYEDDIINYYFGIDSDESNKFRPEFQADSAFRAQFELYAQYPLSQSWSFNAGITQSIYSPSIKDSPLVDKSFITNVMAGVQYVF